MSVVTHPVASREVLEQFESPVFRADPYRTYATIRATTPICYIESRDPPTWWLTRYDDVVAMLRDPRLSAARETADLQGPGVPEKFQRFGQMLGCMMLLKDGSDHQRLRSLVNKAFTPRMVEKLRPRIEVIVERLLDDMLARGEAGMDVIRDLATPLPVVVIAELLGIPVQDQVRFKRWSDRIAVVLDGTVRSGGLPEAVESAGELGEYLHHVIYARRRDPRQDLISAMVSARSGADALSDDELVANCTLLLVAGHETTTNLIGNGMLALMRHPDQLKHLCENPDAIANAVEECLRYDPAIQMTSRVPSVDVEFRGVCFSKGIEVSLILAAANRDPDRFEAPDHFDIGRRGAPHLSFGYGTHFCLGAPLARLEAEVAISALLRRAPHIQLELQDPPRLPGVVLRGVTSLPVRAG